MIRQLESIAGPEGSRPLAGLVRLSACAAVVQGLALGALLPVLVALVRGDDGTLFRWAAVLGVLAAVHAALTVVGTMRGQEVAVTLVGQMHQRLARCLMHLPMSWFDARSSATASHLAVRGTMHVVTAGTDVVGPIVSYVVTPATLVVVALVVDPVVGLALLACAPCVALSTWLASRWTNHAEDRVRSASRCTDEALLDLARNQLALRGAGMAGSRFAQLAEAVEEQRRAGRAAQWASVAGMVVQGFVVQTAFGAVVACAVWRALGGADPVRMIALVVLVSQITRPLGILAELGTALHRSDSELDEVAALLDHPVLPEPDAPLRAPTTPPRVTFRGVRFGYDDRPVLDGLDLDLEPGSVTALVGASGSGKTTVTRLVARFYDVEEGTVALDGVDVRDMASADLLDRVSLVFQDVYLLDDTLEANIRSARLEATPEELQQAARIARVDEIVDRLPHGWANPVGEGGRLLSGGERQRVSIARAVLKRAPLLLLDEATSALDGTTAAAVRDALQELADVATVLVIAHQAATVQTADEVLLLDQGRVVARGTHADLLHDEPRYRRLWAARDEATRWTLPATTERTP